MRLPGRSQQLLHPGPYTFPRGGAKLVKASLLLSQYGSQRPIALQPVTAAIRSRVLPAAIKRPAWLERTGDLNRHRHEESEWAGMQEGLPCHLRLNAVSHEGRFRAFGRSRGAKAVLSDGPQGPGWWRNPNGNTESADYLRS